MPNIAYGTVSKKSLPDDVLRKNFDYDYPEGLDLKPGSKFHQNLVDEILIRARESANTMTTRHTS